MNDHKPGWIQTFTGRKFWPLDPKPEDVDIIDIAHGLAHKCRFNGQCKEFYSVAQHSVHVAEWVAPQDYLAAMFGLLHDAAEAYLPDVPSPIKPFLTGFKEIEANVMAVVHKAIMKVTPDPAHREYIDGLVKRADKILLLTEARDLMGFDCSEQCGIDDKPLHNHIVPWSPREAEAMFIAKFQTLVAEFRSLSSEGASHA